MKHFLLLLHMTPAIITVVQNTETLICGEKMGQQKLNHVLNVVQAAAAGEPEIETALKDKNFMAALVGIIGTTVTTINVAKGK